MDTSIITLDRARDLVFSPDEAAWYVHDVETDDASSLYSTSEAAIAAYRRARRVIGNMIPADAR